MLFFQRLQTTVSSSLPHERRERFSARSKIITKTSVCIRGIKKRELVDMYTDDFQNILREQRP